MNRKICAALAIVVACGGNLSSRAGTIAPGIGGTVYFDQDKNGSPSGSESIPGVSLNLYRDDNNNGVFDSGTDSLVGNMLSNASGFYCFEGLNFSSNYFVQRPAQTVGSFNLPAEVSAPLKPFTPSVLIDDFVNNQVTKANPNTPTATSTLFDPTSNILGGERDLYTRLSSGVGDVELRSNAYGVHVLQFDNSSGVIGQGIVTWDGKDMSANPIPSLGLGNVDLTKGGQATGFLLQLGIDAAGANEKVRLRLFKDSNSEFSEISVAFPVTGGTASEWAYAPFTDLIGSVLPNNVNAIQMLLGQGAKSVDAQVGNISSVGPTKQDFAVVPEPTSLLMLLAGSLGLLAGRRR